MEVVIHAKERQAAEANKNASILLQELDQEKVNLMLMVHVGYTMKAVYKTGSETI